MGVWLWYLPVLAAEAKPKQARRLARDRVVAAIEERHARSGAPAAAGTSG
uniref:Uncharacterized protein n=1 Tax=Streptomyces sp. NBC_00049 TaxID=2903617 RepID=A0AAU2JM64_9ACTN